MGQCVSKRSSSSSSSPSPSSVVDEALQPPLPKPGLKKSLDSLDQNKIGSGSSRTFLFVKRLTLKDNKKSLEQRGCQNICIKTITSSSYSPHGDRVRPVELDPSKSNKTPRRGVVLEVDEEVPDPKPNHPKLKERSSLEGQPTENLASVVSSQDAPVAPDPVLSPLRRLNDLKLEQKMLRDRFFSTDKGQSSQNQGQEVQSKKNGYSSPSPVKIIPSSANGITATSPNSIPAAACTVSLSPIAPVAKLSPSPGSKTLSEVQRKHGTPPLQQQSFIPRPAGPINNAINCAGPNINKSPIGERLTKVPSGIPRFHSPTGSKTRKPGGHIPRVQLPTAPTLLSSTLASSHQIETEEVNRFRVDSSYVVNKAGGAGGFSGMSRVKQEKMVGVPNRPVSAATCQPQGIGKKVIPTRSLYSPYNSSGSRQTTGSNKNLVKRPEVTRPFYTMLYQGAAAGEKRGDTTVGALQAKAGLVPTINEGPYIKKGETLVIRSITWTKEEDTANSSRNTNNNATTISQLPSELEHVEDNHSAAFASDTQSASQSQIYHSQNQSQSTISHISIPVSKSTESASTRVAASASYTKYSVPLSNFKEPLIPMSTGIAISGQGNLGNEASSICRSSSSYTVLSNQHHQQMMTSSSSISHLMEKVGCTPNTKNISATSVVTAHASTESPKIVSRSINIDQHEHRHGGHRLSTDKLFHSSTNSSVLSSNDNNEMSSDSDYLIDDEIEDQPDLITTTTTLKTDNNSSLLQLASNIGSSLESLQIESDYSDDDLLHKDNRLDLSGLLTKDGGVQLVKHDEVITTTDSNEEEGLDKIELISLHSDDTASNTSEKVDDIKIEANANPVNANAISGTKSDTKVKKRLSASSRGTRGTPTNKMVLDRTMNYELRSSHRTVVPSKKTIELPSLTLTTKSTPKYPGVKNGALNLKQSEEARKTNEDLLCEVQDLKRTLFQLKTVLEEQNRREKEKDEVINKLLQEVDYLKKLGSGGTEEVDAKVKTEDHCKISDVDDATLLKVGSHSELHQSHHSIAKSVIKKS